jgi:cysteine-rich repeat protein
MEECDDGNINEGDGCGPTCLKEHPEVCPGTLIHLAEGQSITIAATTAGASDKFVGSAQGVPGNCIDGNWNGPDLVYQVIPAASGMLTVDAGFAYDDPYVHVRTQCPGTKNDTLACYYRSTMGTGQLTIDVQKDVSYFVVMDSWNNKSGGFTLKLSLN